MVKLTPQKAAVILAAGVRARGSIGLGALVLIVQNHKKNWVLSCVMRNQTLMLKRTRVIILQTSPFLQFLLLVI